MLVAVATGLTDSGMRGSCPSQLPCCDIPASACTLALLAGCAAWWVVWRIPMCDCVAVHSCMWCQLAVLLPRGAAVCGWLLELVVAALSTATRLTGSVWATCLVVCCAVCWTPAPRCVPPLSSNHVVFSVCLALAGVGVSVCTSPDLFLLLFVPPHRLPSMGGEVGCVVCGRHKTGLQKACKSNVPDRWTDPVLATSGLPGSPTHMQG